MRQQHHVLRRFRQIFLPATLIIGLCFSSCKKHDTDHKTTDTLNLSDRSVEIIDTVVDKGQKYVRFHIRTPDSIKPAKVLTSNSKIDSTLLVGDFIFVTKSN